MAKPDISGVKRGNGNADDTTVAAIFNGVNLTQLGVIFKLDHRTVVRKLFEGQVKPVAKQGATDLYSIRDCAPYLVPPVFDIESAIKKMSFRDLPKDLAKEFWAGQRTKQQVEEQAGLLWRTEKVVQEVGELMKLVKMSTLLMQDGVERQTELTDRQREIVKSLSNGMLADLMSRVKEKFVVPDTPLYVEPQDAIDDEAL